MKKGENDSMKFCLLATGFVHKQCIYGDVLGFEGGICLLAVA